MPPNSRDFQQELDNLFASAQQIGKSYIDVRSGDLHERVGGYHGSDHRMPICCSVMKKNIRAGDQILDQPPSGQGATLVIRYRLPR